MRENAALRDFNPAYVADGSKTVLTSLKWDVCISPESRHRPANPPCPFRANTGSGMAFGTPGAIDLRPIPSDSMDMEMQCPNWKSHSWLPYCWAILIFSCSRVVVALGLVFSQKYLAIGRTDVWSAGPIWYQQLLQWDSEWYFKIVTEGYRYNGDPTIQQNIVFYPLYPMLARGLAAISGISAPNALLLVANISGFCAILLLFKLVREEFRDDLGLASVALLSFFPA